MSHRRFAAAALLAAACSDYNLSPDKSPNPGVDTGGLPALEVSPDAVLAAGACGSGDATVTLRNAGDAPLTIDAIAASAGWSWSGLSLPLTLAPAGEAWLTVRGSGSGALTVSSDDRDAPVQSVPLAAAADGPPTISADSPSSGSTLAPGDLPLVVRVSDAETAPDALVVTWESDVDGPLGAATVDGAGTASLLWGARSPGPHTLRATVTDACGQSATLDLGVCQQAGYTVDHLDIASWNFEGAARWDSANTWVELTPAVENQVGTAFATDSTVSADNVDISFLFFIGGGSGADGISLTALDSTRATTFLGGTGCGMGYGGDAVCTAGPALPGWSLEVDTHFNDGQDPTAADHLTFTFDGDVDDPAVWVEIPEMEEPGFPTPGGPGWHELSVRVLAPRLTVLLDGVPMIDQDLPGLFGFPAWIGFTAGTGGLTNTHVIDSLTVTETICPE